MAVVGGQAGQAPIDWAAAVRAGQRLAPTGPAVTSRQAADVVADLRAFSARAELAVRKTTDLGHDLPVDDAEIVLAARPNDAGLNNNEGPRHRSCRPGFWIKRENGHVTLMVD